MSDKQKEKKPNSSSKLTVKNDRLVSHSMNWKIYNTLINNSRDVKFRPVRLRLALLLLALTKAKVSELLLIKVRDLKSLQNNFVVEVKSQTLLIGRDSSTRKAIDDRIEDFNYVYRIKHLDDYIFTKDIDSDIPICRETLTRIVNSELKSTGQELNPPRRLTSRSFQNWGE